MPRADGGPTEDVSMKDDDNAALEDLGKRVRSAHDKQVARDRPPPSRYAGASGMGLGAKVLVDFLAGIGLGAGIGWALDYWLGSRPWGIIVFCVLGFVAGLLNVIRTANQAQRKEDDN